MRMTDPLSHQLQAVFFVYKTQLFRFLTIFSAVQNNDSLRKTSRYYHFNMVTSDYFSNIVSFSCIIFLTILGNVRTQEDCTKNLNTIDCARSTGNIRYVEHGKSINLYCVIKENNTNEQDSKQLYFTRNNVTLSNDLITIMNSTAIQLYLKKPPISESIYTWRLKNSNKLIDWTAVVVGTKPQPVTDFACRVCNYKNFTCTWTRLENTNETSYEVIYSFPTENGLYTTSNCLNKTFDKDGKKMSCVWTLKLNSQSSSTPKELYFQLKMKNRFGITRISIPYSESNDMGSDGSLQDCPRQELSQPSLLSTTHFPYKIVCYADREARTRVGPTRFGPDNIDASLCTHIVYADAGIDKNTLNLELGDIDLARDSKVADLKAKGVKVFLGVFGMYGMPRPQEPKYLSLIYDARTRKRFIENAVEFLQKNNFDGLEVISFFQKCFGVDCGPESNKPAFTEFIRELYDALTGRKLLLSITVPGTKADIDAGYDLLALSNYLQWITIDTGIYRSGWKFTEHRAPLYVRDEDEDHTANTNFTVHYVIGTGVDKRKFLLTMPALGVFFILNDTRQNGLRAPCVGAYFPTYYEMCGFLYEEWTVVRDPEKRIGPYAYLDTNWIAYDDAAMIRYKSEYVKSMGLGGAGVWFAADDFNNSCSCESYPILKAANRVLRNYTVPDPNCQLPPCRSHCS
ncbi:hypothetical protein ILUMI_05457 [Ignelater luminosus]|uniref:GH18 domain-containing protein n=1 Tax=Ignelater luminosus TaxID=2038154 RepID=A0A8K0GGC5_IGNLU|nr:hypothetical protein ILUMI_05457 [Ignelater luminosus]